MRQSGILLPVTSLPSPYGIGTMGKTAYNWIDFLENAKQSYWQVLPLGPTSFKDSPYQTFSAFAGNPYLIDLDMLVEEGCLLYTSCRPCKEQNNWEIKDQNGNVLNEHYETKEACVCAGKKLATECDCGLTVCDHTETK